MDAARPGSSPPPRTGPAATRSVEAAPPAAKLQASVAAPPTAAAGLPVTLNWEECVALVADTSPSVAPFLEMGQCVGIEGNEVTIGFSPTASVARARMETEDNLRAVREVCERLAGSPVRVRVVELADGQAPGLTMAQQRAARQREEKMVLFEQTRAHPLVRQTLDAFGGDLTDVRRLSSEQEANNS